MKRLTVPLYRPSLNVLRHLQPMRFASSKKSSGDEPATKADVKLLAQQREKLAQRERAKKIEEKRMSKLKMTAKQGLKSPLCLDIQTALRYLRAAEVGRPAHATTITLNLTIVAEKGQALLQGSFRLPRALEQQRICVFTNDPEAAEQARQAGATLVGSDEIIDQVKNGIINFDNAFATPDMVHRLAQLGRILGPKNLMPSARRGTVTKDIYKAVNEAAGETLYKQTTSTLSLPVARAYFSDYDIIRNIVAVMDAIRANMSKIDSKKAPTIGLSTLRSTVGPNIIIEV